MADLPWLPYDADEWERRVRDLGLSLADEGALMRLIRGAWRAADPCTIADTPDEMARIVGAEWKKALRVFRAQFAPLPDQPTRRRCGWLYDLYLRQLEKHLSYSTRGRTGGKAKADKRSSATAQLEAQLEAEPESLLRESSTEALTCAPTEHTGKSPLDDSGPAPAGAAPADVASTTANSNGTGDYLRAPGNREALARAGYRPDPDAPPVPVTPLAEQAAELHERADRYRSLLEGAATDWQDEHPEEAIALEHEERGRQGLRGRSLGLMATQALRQAVVEAIRTRLGWPTIAEWDGSDSLTPSEVPASC